MFPRTASGAALLSISRAARLCSGAGPDRPLPSWNDSRAEAGHRRLRREGDARRARPTSCPSRNASPCSTMTARCGSSIRCTSSSPSRSTASRRWRRSIPEWRTTQPFQAVLEGDMKALAAAGEKGMMRDHHGDACRHDHRGIPDRSSPTGSPAPHPRFKRPYTELVYQPMLELLAYLRANGFKTFIVSGGGIEFMRPWTEQIYGIPPEQVVGLVDQDTVRDARRKRRRCSACRRSTSSTTRPASRSASTSISAAGRSPRSAIPTAICRCCNGRRWPAGARFGLIVHHTDAEREYAYDRDTQFGRLDKALDAAAVNQLDGRRHEDRLEGRLPVRVEVILMSVQWCDQAAFQSIATAFASLLQVSASTLDRFDTFAK